MKKYAYMDTVFTLSEASKKNDRTLHVTHDAGGGYTGMVQAKADEYRYSITFGGSLVDTKRDGTTTSSRGCYSKGL